MRKQTRINIGCGMSPTRGWLNFDNSTSIKLSKYPVLARGLFKLKLIEPAQMTYISFCQSHDILWADATRRIPLPDNSVDVLYSSHMLEHLDRVEAGLFLAEANRVLVPGGMLRLALPDLEKIVATYRANGDADAFVESAHMCAPRPRSLLARLKNLVTGARHHHWMYDGASLSKLVAAHGFRDATVLESGETGIENHEPLDLREREDESVYVEAAKV